ncbi:uncharacterized protein [Anabrus simplex]|uniref:uncharacterized protein n=1 Tax=Anabrus simplex TaxID=316456 RepID=UPI0035A2763E
MLGKVLVLTIVTTAVWTIADSADTAAELYNSLPKEEKRHFLAYNLAIVLDPHSKKQSHLGIRPERVVNQANIPNDLIQKYDDMELPEDVSTTLYNWIQRKGNYSRADMHDLLLRNYHCLPCIDLDNPGGNCCF